MSKARKYRVSGPLPVLGHKPGETFTAVIPPEQEARLISRGQITRVAVEAAKQESADARDHKE